MRTVRSRASVDRVQLVEPLEDPHAREPSNRASGRSDSRPASGTSAASRNASGHDVRDTVAAKTIGATIPIPESTDCWKPIAAPLRAAPASSAAAANASAFQPMDRPPATASAGTSSHSGPPASAATTTRQPATTTPTFRSGPIREPTTSDHAARADASPDRENLRRGDDERGLALREPVLVVQEDDAEPDHRDLGVDVDAAPECETPETAVAQRSRERLLAELVLVAVPASDKGDADDRADHAQRGEEQEAASRIAGRGQLRDDQRGDEPTERDRRLPDARARALARRQRTSA